MPVIIVLTGMLFVGVFLTLFNQFYSQSSKKEYLNLLLKLEENPDDNELKDKAIEAGRAYNRKQTLITSRFSSISYGQTGISESAVNEAIKDAINHGKKKLNS